MRPAGGSLFAAGLAAGLAVAAGAAAVIFARARIFRTHAHRARTVRAPRALRLHS